MGRPSMTTVPPPPTPAEGSLRHRVARERRAGFVGRSEELGLFERARTAETDAPRILLVHGPGGIGKSALLRRFADAATDATVVTIDGDQLVDPATATSLLAPLRSGGRGVLLIDRFEECSDLEDRVREDVLLALPEPTVVVIAGRWQPDAVWTLDPGWRPLVEVRKLGPLPPQDAAQLLEAHDVAPDARADLERFARGHPLALHLAARDWHDGRSVDETGWRPGAETVQRLREVLVGPAPTVEADYALRVTGHVRYTTVDLLRAVLQEEQAIAAFEWLRARSWARAGPDGVTADDLVRDVLDTDLAWRDPRGHEELRERLWDHLGERVQTTEGDALVAAVRELVRLHRHGSHPVLDLFDSDLDDGITEHAYEPSMRDDVLALARGDGGEQLAGQVDRWLELRPGDFSVYRRDGVEIVAFLGLLRIPGPTKDDVDPALAAVGRHLERTSGTGSTDRVGIARFVVPRPLPDRSTPAGAHVSLRISIEQVRCAGALAASYLLLPRSDEFAPVIAAFDHVLVGPVEDMDDGTWGLFVHDWRDVGLAEHLRRCRPVAGATTESLVLSPPPAPALSRPAHEEAVKQVLRDWHDEVALAANPLCSVDVAELRGRVRDAVSALGEDPRRIKPQRAVAATFLDRRTTQQAAAARLDLPFSTFRRHLRRGVDDVADHLWTHRPLSKVE